MPDPHVLYTVTAAVVLGLIAWVAVVLSRPARDDSTVPLAQKQPGAKARASTGPSAGAGSPGSPESPSHRPKKLDSHREIRDAPVAEASADLPIDVEEEEEQTGPTALILVTAVGRTDPGLKRKHNEDAYAILEDHHLFVIADGMGRHAAGEVASQLCVEAISEAFRTGSFGPPCEPPLPRRASKLRGSILLANERVLRASQEKKEYAGMGTTVVSAYFAQNNQRVYIAHVGDSRCYRLRGNKLVQLTTDHTLGNAGVKGASASVLSRAVGVDEKVKIDVTMESPLPGDIYLLCSDGLSRMVSSKEIQATLEATPDLEHATKILVDKANQGGGRDNITTILVRVEDARLGSAKMRAAAPG
jgi:protein phosphatase